MTSVNKPLPPAGISREAKEMLKVFHAENQTQTPDLTIQERRDETRQASADNAQNAIDHHRVSVSVDVIAGITCQIITPEHRTENRCILYLFGGGFCFGSPFEDLPISAALAAKTGARVIAPDYRLAPEHPFPAALNDIEAVANAVLADCPETLLAGESAGGNLALALCHRLRAQGLATPKAAALFSPATDISSRGETALAETCNDPMLSPDRITEVEALYVPNQDLRNPEISPIYGRFGPDFPICFITTGTRDLLLSSCVRLAHVMRQSGATVDLRVWEGMWHVFEFYPEIPESDASLTEIADFLESQF